MFYPGNWQKNLGVPASGQSENPQNQNDGVDWDKMMSLEHMKINL